MDIDFRYHSEDGGYARGVSIFPTNEEEEQAILAHEIDLEIKIGGGWCDALYVTKISEQIESDIAKIVFKISKKNIQGEEMYAKYWVNKTTRLQDGFQAGRAAPFECIGTWCDENGDFLDGHDPFNYSPINVCGTTLQATHQCALIQVYWIDWYSRQEEGYPTKNIVALIINS